MNNKKKKAENAIYVYAGPSIRGVIQCGTIYRGTKDEVLTSIADVIEKYPQVKYLIAKDTELSEIKAKIKSGGYLSTAYKALAAAAPESRR